MATPLPLVCLMGDGFNLKRMATGNEFYSFWSFEKKFYSFFIYKKEGRKKETMLILYKFGCLKNWKI